MLNVPYLTSCNHCREKKRKCNGEKPACALCRAHGVACEYRRSRRFRKRAPHPSAETPASFAETSTAAPPIAVITTSQPLPATPLPMEDNALSRLLTGDMYSQTQIPQSLLQNMNQYMSPFSGIRGVTSGIIPEEAQIISNLENIASSSQPMPRLQPGGPIYAQYTEEMLLGNLATQFMQGSNVFQPNPFQITRPMEPLVNMPAMNIPLGVNIQAKVPSPGESYRTAASAPQNGRSPSVSSSAATPDLPPKIASQAHLSKLLASDISGNKRSNSRASSVPRLENQKQKRPRREYPDDFVPEIIQIYAEEFPAPLSPQLLLKVMKGVYGNTRTSLINVDLELSWCMILKNVVPRILLFSYIAGMARGQVIDPELVPQLPDKFDEICYEFAVQDIPLVLDNPTLWSVLALHMIGRYEFQSARYDLMQQHYEMAAEVMTKTTFHGYSFPWKDVPEEMKQTFEYDYYVYTFWVGFQWHLVCCFNLDREFNVNMDPHMLPIPNGNQGYFGPELRCGFDLLSLLPRDSWPRDKLTNGVDHLWFSGFDNSEYDGWRPQEWDYIRPNYKITLYLQRMLPLGAQLYRLQENFCADRITVADYIQGLNSQQEQLRRWLYSVPEEFEISKERVAQLTRAASGEYTPDESSNMVMDFKELVMTFGLYHTLLVRSNRLALLGMVGERTLTPATSTMRTKVFGYRDYWEAMEGRPEVVFGSREYGMWQKNLVFQKCRLQCYESMNMLCDVVHLSFVLRLNLFTYGTSYLVIAGEMMNVLVSQLVIKDRLVQWKTKGRLAHVLCLLRSLQHWAPAIYLFVYGIQLLSDPRLVLEPMEDKRERQAQGGKAVPEIPNPFRRNHIINLIVEDLDTSLAVFLAPAYPMLLLKIFSP